MTQFCCYLSGFISGFTLNCLYNKCYNKKKSDRIHTFNEEIIIDQPTFQDHINTQNIYPQIARPCRRNRQIPIANATITV